MGGRVLEVRNLYMNIEKYLKTLLLEPLIFARYRKLRPSRARLPGHNDNWVHFDPKDRRAIKKFLYDNVRNRISPPLAFWRAFNQHLKPELLVDIGVNYGECLFGDVYGQNSCIYGFEANPRLIQYLEKSRAEHKNCEQIKIFNCLVSDQPVKDVPFYVDPSWSGTASAIKDLHLGSGTISFKVDAKTIDSLIFDPEKKSQTLLFKMDIEGYEPYAMKGFSDILEAVTLAVGFMEFDSVFLMGADADPIDFYNYLDKIFDIHVQTKNAHVIKKINDYKEISRSRASDQRIHTDFILVKKSRSRKDWFPPGWTVE